MGMPPAWSFRVSPMPPVPFVHLLLGAALMIALGFHRHRAAQICALLWLLLVADESGDPRLQQGASAFVPWLLLAAALLPEARLLSRRHAVFLGVMILLTAFSRSAPAHVFEQACELLRWPMSWLPEQWVLVAPGGLAALLCLGRWSIGGRSVDLGLAMALLLAMAGSVAGEALPAWYAASAGCLLLSILWTSYRMAFIDQLTGLPNRRALDETLARLSGAYTLAMVDIDHFKSFNDTYGHDAGDVVLRAVARTLRRNSGGRTFRYGGEEFCVVYANVGSQDAAASLEHARGQVEAQRIVVTAPKRKARASGKRPARKTGTGDGVSVTISAGCAPRDDRRRQPDEVLKAADRALYKAKAKGRNRVVRG
jgi:diguanylate cyclase (GGDEF)-like protein